MTSPSGIRAGVRARPSGNSALAHRNARRRGPAAVEASSRSDASVKSLARPSIDPRASWPQRRETPPGAPAIQRHREHALTRDPGSLGQDLRGLLDELQGDHEDTEVNRPAPDRQVVGVALDQGQTGMAPPCLRQHRRRPVEPDHPGQPAAEPSREVSGPAAHLERALRRRERSQQTFDNPRSARSARRPRGVAYQASYPAGSRSKSCQTTASPLTVQPDRRWRS